MQVLLLEHTSREYVATNEIIIFDYKYDKNPLISLYTMENYEKETDIHCAEQHHPKEKTSYLSQKRISDSDTTNRRKAISQKIRSHSMIGTLCLHADIHHTFSKIKIFLLVSQRYTSKHFLFKSCPLSLILSICY